MITLMFLLNFFYILGVLRQPVHSWPRCPEADIRPEAILSRAFGTSCTASHRSVTLFKGPESLHKPKYDFEAPKGFA